MIMRDYNNTFYADYENLIETKAIDLIRNHAVV